MGIDYDGRTISNERTYCGATPVSVVTLSLEAVWLESD